MFWSGGYWDQALKYKPRSKGTPCLKGLVGLLYFQSWPGILLWLFSKIKYLQISRMKIGAQIIVILMYNVAIADWINKPRVILKISKIPIINRDISEIFVLYLLNVDLLHDHISFVWLFRRKRSRLLIWYKITLLLRIGGNKIIDQKIFVA